MAIFTPPDIGGGLRDFVDYIRVDRPHRWPALGVALAVPLVIGYFMARSINPEEAPKRTIVYVESWRADRSDYDVRRDWLQRAREANERNRRRRDAYGAFARTLGQDYDVDRADDEFGAALADIAAAEREVDAAEREGRPIRDLTRDRRNAAAGSAAPPAAPAANR
jgi:hypothetical protein